MENEESENYCYTTCKATPMAEVPLIELGRLLWIYGIIPVDGWRVQVIDHIGDTENIRREYVIAKGKPLPPKPRFIKTQFSFPQGIQK